MWMTDNSWAEPHGTPQERSTLRHAERPLWAWGKGIMAEGRGKKDSRLLESQLSCR